MAHPTLDHRDTEPQAAAHEAAADEPAVREATVREPAAHEPPVHEPVRLLIWDLDETFWRGTLSEGGITLRDDTIDIVKPYIPHIEDMIMREFPAGVVSRQRL